MDWIQSEYSQVSHTPQMDEYTLSILEKWYENPNSE